MWKKEKRQAVRQRTGTPASFAIAFFLQAFRLYRTGGLQYLCCPCKVQLYTDPLYVKDSTDFYCFCLRQTISFCFLSVLQPLQTLRIPESFYPLHLSKGMGLKREGEASFPFLCFWFLLSQYKRNILFSFPWKRSRFFPACH